MAAVRLVNNRNNAGDDGLVAEHLEVATGLRLPDYVKDGIEETERLSKMTLHRVRHHLQHTAHKVEHGGVQIAKGVTHALGMGGTSSTKLSAEELAEAQDAKDEACCIRPPPKTRSQMLLNFFQARAQPLSRM